MTNPQLAAVYSLATRLLEDLLARTAGQNVFISPVSIQMSLAAVANGAVGETYDAIATTLGLSGATPTDLNTRCEQTWDQLARMDEEAYEDQRFGARTEPRVRAALANGLWLNHRLPFEPAFVQTVRGVYRAEVAGADFGAPETAEIINRWVSEHTAGNIRAIAGQLDPMTVLILISAVHFKGGWASVFKPEQTAEAPFTLPDGSQTPCDLMQQTTRFFYAESDLLQLVVLPFVGTDPHRQGKGGANMIVVLPRPGRTPAEALAHLGSNWRLKAYQLQGRLTEVELSLPRFRIAYEARLNDTLAALGMGPAFDQGRADFSGLSSTRPVWISEVKHKTTLLVNEQGAEASGGTMVSMMLGIHDEPPKMRVDRPFLCTIVAGGDWTPVFIGVINRPERVPAS